MTLNVRHVTDPEELAELSDPWGELAAMASGDVFALPGWHQAWWSTMGSQHQIHVLVAEDAAGTLRGLLPLAVRRGGPRDGFARLLEFSGGSQADVHDVVAATGEAADVLALFSEPARAIARTVDGIRLTGVPDDSRLFAWTGLMARAPTMQRSVLPQLSLAGTYEELESRWRKAHRTDVRRQTKRLEGLGRLSLRVLGDANEARRELTTYLDVHTDSWAQRGFRERARNVALRDFFAALIDELWETGVVHFSRLEVDGEPISFHFGFLCGGRFYWYKPAYVQSYANYSPGKVHIAKLLALGVSEGWTTFDLLRGAEPYKQDWADSERSVSDVISFNRTPRGALSAVASRVRTGQLSGVLRRARRLVGR